MQLRVGDRITLYAAASTAADAATVLARAVPVVALPAPRSTTSGALIVVAAAPEAAARLAQAGANAHITVALTPDTS